MTGAPREMDWEVMSSEVMGVSHSPTGAVFCTAMTVMQAVVVPALCGLRLHKSIARSAQRNLVRDSGKALRTSMGTAPMPDVPHRITRMPCDRSASMMRITYRKNGFPRPEVQL